MKAFYLIYLCLFPELETPLCQSIQSAKLVLSNLDLDLILELPKGEKVSTWTPDNQLHSEDSGNLDTGFRN